MDLYIGTYREMSEKDQFEIKGLIIKGNEANASLVGNRLNSSALIAYFKDGDSIVATTSIKIPEIYYVNEVFEKALADLNPSKYIFELGYVFVESPNRNQKLASILCRELMNKFKKEHFFSTTRTDNLGMKSILNTLGFVQAGISYLSMSKTKLIQLYLLNCPVINQEKSMEFDYDECISQS